MPPEPCVAPWLKKLKTSGEGYPRNAESLSEPRSHSHFILVPMWDRFRVYDSVIERIGLLHSAEIAAVTRAYGFMISMPDFIMTMGILDRVEGRLVGRVDPAYRDNLRQMYIEADERIQTAIVVLEGNLK
jgi:hypothetical protein